jgi:hypothetical protein
VEEDLVGGNLVFVALWEDASFGAGLVGFESDFGGE